MYFNFINMETLFNQIQQLICDGLPWLNGNADEDYGQLDMLYKDDEDSDTYPITFPLVLIDIPETQWTSLGGAFGKVQTGTTSISVKLVLDCYHDTHYTSGTASKAEERADMVHDLHSLLQSQMLSGNTSPLDRKTSRCQTMVHGIKVYELVYECRTVDKVTP